MTSVQELLRGFLMFGLLPLWLAAGFADYLCHRSERIELSAGWPESLLHLLMLAELGVGVLAALLLQINAAVLALALACCIAHEVTIWVDLGYTNAR
ncbi:MAG TPA: diguanylate cyclase, partial [Rubrivivax sp.]|nr:diguanylate cyclase [Rubrivivax sp.]